MYSRISGVVKAPEHLTTWRPRRSGLDAKTYGIINVLWLLADSVPYF
jgi:hypothetical protein